MHGDRCALEHTGGANQIHFLLWWSLPTLVGNNRVKGRYWMSVTKLNILTSYTLYTLLPTSAGNGDDEYVDCDHYMMADIMMLAVNTTRI